jgi:hypothetical protein
VGSYDLGETIEELHQGFPTLSVAQIKRLIELITCNASSHITREGGLDLLIRVKGARVIRNLPYRPPREGPQSGPTEALGVGR